MKIKIDKTRLTDAPYSEASKQAFLTAINSSMGHFFNIAKENLNYSAQTALNTGNTVLELKKTNEKLDNLVKNTKSNGVDLRGSGYSNL